MNDLSYIFGPNPVDRPKEISQCFIAQIKKKGAKTAGGAQAWWQVKSEQIWNDAKRSRAREDYVWANEDDAKMITRFDELTLEEQQDLASDFTR